MKNIRCEEVIAQLVIRTYDDAGCPTREQVSQAVKVFRNTTTADFWTFIDANVAAMQQAQSTASAESSSAPTSARAQKPKRKR